MTITNQDMYQITWTDGSNDNDQHLDILGALAKRHHLSFYQLREACNWITTGGEVRIDFNVRDGYRLAFSLHPSSALSDWKTPKEFMHEYRELRFEPAIPLDDENELWQMIRKNSCIDITDGQTAYLRAEAYVYCLMDCHLIDPDHAGYLLTEFRRRYVLGDNLVGPKGLMGKKDEDR